MARAINRHSRLAVQEGFPAEDGFPSFLSRFASFFNRSTGPTRSAVWRLLESGILDPATFQGLLLLVRMSAEAGFDRFRARAGGEYEIAPFGLDPEFLDRVRPFLRFMYRYWWRVKVSGLENVPSVGRALLIANHSGVIAWDAAMVATAVLEHHPASRLPRALHLQWFVKTPFAAAFLQRTGQLMACHENGERLLAKDELVTVFPEGAKGAGKLYRERYRLARFGRGGYVRMALRSGAPIVPIAIVGAEEIHPVLAKSDVLARLFSLPYFPITPTFPWLGPLGLIPLPSRWRIHFGKPIDLSSYPPDSAEDFHLVSQVSDEVRYIIQQRIHKMR